MRAGVRFLVFAAVPGLVCGQTPWMGYAHDAQHTGVSSVASQPLNSIHWQTTVDQNVSSGNTGTLLIHYGSPIVTAANTVLVPVRTNPAGFEIEAFNGNTATGSTPTPVYTLTTSYTSPPSSWTPPYTPVLSTHNRLYYADAGGAVDYRDNVDSPTGPNGSAGMTGQILFYPGPANNAVQISTPLMSDRYGDIYFGFVVGGGGPAGLSSGIARISLTGVGSWKSALTYAGGDTKINDPSINQVSLNCAPAMSNNQLALYFAVSNGSSGYLVEANSTTLALMAHVLLVDPVTGEFSTLTSQSTSSPMVGPDGDVYYGVLETPCCSSHNDRGWMLHFNSALTTTKTPGSFGWDNTPSIVSPNLVPSYSGTSTYLIETKYNNYKNGGGSGPNMGVNQIAVLDPQATMTDKYSTATVMKEVLTINGVTPDPTLPDVREWCINDAAIDPFTKSALVNSEDGNLYRWDFTTNSFTEKKTLVSPGVAEAYTPTVIGVDGTVYAINDAILFAIGK